MVPDDTREAEEALLVLGFLARRASGWRSTLATGPAAIPESDTTVFLVLRLLLETGVGLFGSGIERIRRSSSKQPARATVRSLLRYSLTTSHAHFRGPVDPFQLKFKSVQSPLILQIVPDSIFVVP